MQTPEQIKSRLFSLLNRGVKYDLSRMFKAAALCGDPQNAYRSIHVAGTNGKGSTCAYIESILRHAGYKTGLYTSPHIFNFEERFKIGGVDIDEAMWFDVYKSQEKIIGDLGLTFFEVATLMSFEIFKRAKVDYAIFETGMGGRLDATNVITPVVSVITKLALDHQEYLGGDIVTIAGEKLGIVKPNIPLVMLDPDSRPMTKSYCHVSNTPDENQRIKKLAADKCAAVNSELTFVNTDNVTDVVCDDNGISFAYNGHRYDLSMHGKHQIQNALLALTAISKTFRCGDGRNNHINRIDHLSTYNGIKSTTIPGRFQIANVSNRTVIFDVAHNPDAARVFVDALRERYPDPDICMSFVVGMMKDKDIASTLDIFLERATDFYFAKINTERGAETTELIRPVFGKVRGRITDCDSISEAMRDALASTDEDEIICVTGSFYTVAEAVTSLPFSKSSSPYPPPSAPTLFSV